MKLSLLWFISILLGVSSLVLSETIHASGHEITLISQSAVSDFPNGVKFSIEAASPDEIDEIRVFFKKLGQSNRSSYRAVEFVPGTEIAGESLIVSGRGGEYIPPGTRIEYSFEIQDRADRILRTEEEVFTYLDHRIEWENLSDGLITLYYNDTVLDGRAQAMLEAAQETLQRMGPVLGIDPKDPLHIVTYGEYALMREALPFRAQAVQDNLVTQGTAFSEERVLLVLSAGDRYLGTTSHEFTHLLVADASGRATAKVPAWLNEGLAEYGNIEPGEEYDRYLRRAVENGDVRPLWFQGTLSGTPEEIIVAYGQSKSVVEYMLATYGQQKMADLIVSFKRTFDIDTALVDTYGFDQYGLDTEWRISLGLEPLPEPEEKVSPQQIAPTAPPTIAPTATAVPVPTKTPEPEETEPSQSSPGCGAPGYSGNVLTDVALLALLGGPLAMLSVKRFRKQD